LTNGFWTLVHSELIITVKFREHTTNLRLIIIIFGIWIRHRAKPAFNYYLALQYARTWKGCRSFGRNVLTGGCAARQRVMTSDIGHCRFGLCPRIGTSDAVFI